MAVGRRLDERDRSGRLRFRAGYGAGRQRARDEIAALSYPAAAELDLTLTVRGGSIGYDHR